MQARQTADRPRFVLRTKKTPDPKGFRRNMTEWLKYRNSKMLVARYQKVAFRIE
jgi:hypothetical protein